MGLVEEVGRRVGGSRLGCCARCRFRRAGIEDGGGGFGFSGASFGLLGRLLAVLVQREGVSGVVDGGFESPTRTIACSVVEVHT